ncbi:MAG: YciI family protein [Gemmatimonadota bacterium]
MYALILIRYRRPLEEIVAATEGHRNYLKTLKAEGVLLASGPFDPRVGGALLLRVPDGDTRALDRIRDNDPFFRDGLANYELLPWNPVLGAEGLDQL